MKKLIANSIVQYKMFKSQRPKSEQSCTLSPFAPRHGSMQTSQKVDPTTITCCRPPGNLRLGDVIKGQMRFVLASNYMIDFRWLLSFCPDMMRAGHVQLVYHADKDTTNLMYHPPTPQHLPTGASQQGINARHPFRSIWSAFFDQRG